MNLVNFIDNALYKNDEHQANEWKEVKILIDSLLKLAEFDGKPIFSWEKRKKAAEERTNGTAFSC